MKSENDRRAGGDYIEDLPIIIVGGGACGAAAALAASDAGVTPLVVEQDDRPGGSTGMSQGLVCAAGTRSQRKLGIEDDADIFFDDIMRKARGQTDEKLARTLADHSGPTLEWLQDAHDLPWELDRNFRASYGNTRDRLHGWAGHTGLEMIQLLHRRMSDAGVDVLLQTRLVDIAADRHGRVTAVDLAGPDGVIERIGCRTLILASGGYGGNRTMIERFAPEARALRYHGHEGSRGIAITLGERLGAALGDMGSFQGYAMLSDPQGVSVPPPLILDGGVLINREGFRFVDESVDIAGMVHPMSAQPGGIGWVLFDARIEEGCRQIPEVAQLMQLGASRNAETIEDLARITGAPLANLAATLDQIHSVARSKGHDELGRDWRNAVPPSPPYRAVRVTGALYHTQGGLCVDRDARVLRADGSPLPNLFAGGGAARSVSGPSSWGYLPAMGLTTALVLGSLAGQSAAALVNAG